MTARDLKILFTGTYQLAQAVSYLAEMVDTNGKLRTQYVKDESNVLKLEVVYYLSHARYLSENFKPVEVLSDVFKKNNYISVIESGSDND